jgi:hypothetical protein
MQERAGEPTSCHGQHAFEVVGVQHVETMRQYLIGDGLLSLKQQD